MPVVLSPHCAFFDGTRHRGHRLRFERGSDEENVLSCRSSKTLGLTEGGAITKRDWVAMGKIGRLLTACILAPRHSLTVVRPRPHPRSPRPSHAVLEQDLEVTNGDDA